MPRDGVKVGNGRAGSEQCVFSFVRPQRRMGGASAIGDLESRHRKEALHVQGNLSHLLHVYTNVPAEQKIQVVDDSGFDHGNSPAEVFFVRLKQKLDRAVEAVTVLGKMAGKQQTHCCVDVMPAHVGITRSLRDEAFRGGPMGRIA